jgi:murein DD-endopeptidase MepM/ murein hydrolase activator NlpD
MTGARPRAARVRRWAGRRALALALTVALPAGGLFLPAVAAADGELPAAPDPVPVAIAGMPTLPAAPAPAPDPSAVGAGLPAPVPAAPPPPEAVAAPAVAVAAAALRPLRLGAVGTEVRELQRALRRRGARVAVDGAFGKGTRTAVKLLQRKLGRRATGVADVALLRSLGVSPTPVVESIRVTAASVAAPAAPVVAGLALPVGAPPAPENVDALGARFLRTFPIAGPHSYTNNFGDPRPQGRHEGVDILAPHGTPIVAVADGVIQRMSRQETGRGGLSIWLRDTAGNTYFYGHLASIAEGLEEGTPLTLGQQIATVGNTGDARGGPSHLHFEIHPGDNHAIDPFGELTTVDPAKAVQTPAALARARRVNSRPVRAPARKPGARPAVY